MEDEEMPSTSPPAPPAPLSVHPQPEPPPRPPGHLGQPAVSRRHQRMEEVEDMPGAAGMDVGIPGVAVKEEEMPGTMGKDEEVPKTAGKEEEKNTASTQCCDSRWRVSYSSILVSRKKRIHKGSMLLRAVANRIVLYDNKKTLLDTRNLHVWELIYPGSVIHFPCFNVTVGECIFQPDACIKNEEVLVPSLVTSPQLSGAMEHQLPSNEDVALFTENGEENGKKRMNKKDEKKAKRRKLQEEQNMRDEKKRKLDEEQEMRDAKKRKRLKAAAGMRLVRSPVAMIAKVVSRKQMSPQLGSGRKPRKLTSEVWKEVIPIYKHGRLVQGQCKHCNDIFAASRKSGTNHMHRHLRICKTRSRMHELVAKMCASASSPQASDLDKWEFNQDKSRRELANMVALHDFPFSIVEYA